MWLTLLLLAFLVLIVFGFVLEPIIRAKKDRVVIDSLKLPELPPGVIEETDSRPDSSAKGTPTSTNSSCTEQSS